MHNACSIKDSVNVRHLKAEFATLLPWQSELHLESDGPFVWKKHSMLTILKNWQLESQVLEMQT